MTEKPEETNETPETETAQDAEAPETAEDAEASEAAPAATEETPEEELKVEGLEAEVNETGPCKVDVKVRVPKEAIDAEMGKSFDEIVGSAAVPGFRKGHAPRKLVERHYHDTVFEEVKRLLVARSWQQVRDEKDLHPVGEPDLGEDKIVYDKEKGISYELALEVAPKFDITDYKGLELQKSPSEVTEEDVDRTLDNLRRRNAVLEPVEQGKTKQDDVPVVDCDIKVAGEVIHSVSDQEITLGPDNWLRGVDEEFWKDLLGKSGGESAVKTVTLPQTYQKEEHRGKEAELTVTIKDIKRPRLPELDDAFAKDMLYEGLEELKEDVRQRLGASKEREVRGDLARQVEEKLLAMVDFALPEDLVKRMTENAVNRQRMNLLYQGVPRDEIEKAADQIAAGATAKTERDMRIYFILQQIAEKEEITVNDTELERRIQLLAQLQRQKPGRFRDELRREGRLELLRSEIRDEKTLERLIAEGKVTRTEGKAQE